jgi:hypothetical protein
MLAFHNFQAVGMMNQQVPAFVSRLFGKFNLASIMAGQ